jgi:hypothetical protein
MKKKQKLSNSTNQVSSQNENGQWPTQCPNLKEKCPKF